MFQTKWGKLQGNLHIFIQKHVRAIETFDSELHWQMHIKYRDSAKLKWGAQAFGNVGQWDHWNPASQREFKVGPALFGKFKTGTQEAITWNAAVLVGTTLATPNTTLRLQTEYEF